MGQLDVQTSRPDIIRVYVHAKQDESRYYSLKALKRVLNNVVVKFSTVSRLVAWGYS